MFVLKLEGYEKFLCKILKVCRVSSLKLKSQSFLASFIM
jgi:hypothetical protein